MYSSLIRCEYPELDWLLADLPESKSVIQKNSQMDCLKSAFILAAEQGSAPHLSAAPTLKNFSGFI